MDRGLDMCCDCLCTSVLCMCMGGCLYNIWGQNRGFKGMIDIAVFQESSASWLRRFTIYEDSRTEASITDLLKVQLEVSPAPSMHTVHNYAV